MGYYSDVVITFRTTSPGCTPEKFLEAFARENPRAEQLVRDSGYLERKDGSENTMIAKFDDVKWETAASYGWDGYTDGDPEFEAFEALVKFCQGVAEDDMFANDGAFIRIGESDDDNESRYWGEDSYEMAHIVRSINYPV